MAALSGLWVIAFAFLSLSMLHFKRNYWFGLSLAMAFMATFSQGNGWFVFPAGCVYMFLEKQSIKKSTG